MTPARTLLVTILATTGVLVSTTPAWAHTALTSSSPAAGSTLAAAPTQVRLTFAELGGTLSAAAAWGPGDRTPSNPSSRLNQTI